MNRLPIVTVTPHVGGWLCTCDRCPWEQLEEYRSRADRLAIRHRASHGKAR